jgi:hypothetical protein
MRRLVALSAALALSLQLAPSAGRADIVGPPPRWARGGEGERYVPDARHPFLAGGLTLLGASSPDDLTILIGGTGTAGVEIPTGRSWTFVPRIHLSAADGGRSGSVTWTRLALDARLSTASGGMSKYSEVGLGMGLLNSPVMVRDPTSETGRDQRYCGTPFAQVVLGWRGVPDEARVLMMEFVLALGTGHDSPAAIEAVVGMEF